MISVATHYISRLNTNLVKPAIEWSRKHKMLISAIATSILFGVTCYTTPVILDLTKKNIKFLSIVLPVVYTLTFPIVLVSFVFATENPYACHHDAKNLFDRYCESIIKVWQVWFRFVGISA